MSIFNSLFGNNATTTTQQQTLAGPATATAQNLFARADAYANQPWSGVDPSLRVAGFTGDQNTAFDRARNIAGTNTALFDRLNQAVLGDQDTGALSGLRQTFDQANISGYMNPYVDAVLAPALQDVERRADVTRNNLNANSVRTGSFGGSRNALAQMELERNTLGELGRLSANERAKAFGEAADEYRRDQQILPALRQQDYSNLAMLAGQNTARLAPEVNSLLATGGLQQALQQARMDVHYDNFIENRDWGSRGINALLQTLGTGGSLGSTTQTTSQGPRPNAIGQVLGATTGLLGSLGGLSSVGSAVSDGWNWLSGSGGGGGWASEIGTVGELLKGFRSGGLVGLEA